MDIVAEETYVRMGRLLSLPPLRRERWTKEQANVVFYAASQLQYDIKRGEWIPREQQTRKRKPGQRDNSYQHVYTRHYVAGTSCNWAKIRHNYLYTDPERSVRKLGVSVNAIVAACSLSRAENGSNVVACTHS
jgi:hypothetical protein